MVAKTGGGVMSGVSRGFVLVEAGRGHEASVPCRKPAAPVRARDVADVGDRLAAKLRRSGHSPARHDEFAPLGVAANDRRELVGEDPSEQSQIPGAIVPRAEPVADLAG
jgi:hypothetical protein